MLASELGHVFRVSIRDVDEHERRVASSVATRRLVRLVADIVAATLQLNAVALLETAQLVVADQRELVLKKRNTELDSRTSAVYDNALRILRTLESRLRKFLKSSSLLSTGFDMMWS